MKRLRIIGLLLLLVASCQTPSNFALDSIEYIKRFDTDIQLLEESRQAVKFEVGINNIKLCGPYIIGSTYDPSGYIVIMEKEAPYRYLGSFFRAGRGPGELPAPILASSLEFHRDASGSYYAVFDNRAGAMVRFDIDRSIAEQRTVSEPVGESKRRSFVTVDLGEEGVFRKELSAEKDKQIRFIEKDGEQVITKAMAKLNSAEIMNKNDDGSRFNVLSGSVVYDPATRRFAETPGQINAIHLYALDDSYAKTFCIGNSLYDYNEIADMEREDRPSTSVSTRQFKDYIGVLYRGTSPRERRPDQKLDIILLSWDGKRTARIHLADPASSFDIDFVSKKLYAYDQLAEMMYVYDISSYPKLFF